MKVVDDRLMETEMANPFVHVELRTGNLAKATQFYGRLFDWRLQETELPQGNYVMIQPGEGTGGGMTQCPAEGSAQWLAYVQVEDMDDTLQRAKSLGATVLQDVTEVPDAGWYSVILDPTGAALGLWKAKAA